MPKAYMISAYRNDPDPVKLKAYAELAGPAILAAGGVFLARGGRVTPKENGLNARTVLIEFPSYDAALAAFASPEYQAALVALDNAADRDIRLIEGVE